MTTKSRSPLGQPRLADVLIGLFVLLHFSPSLTWTQAAPAVSDDVGNYVRSEMQRQHIPGVALLVSRGGRIVQAQGFGLANVELQVPVKPETVFQSDQLANNSPRLL
ncbi:MAG: serine hydrolase domain-containing protein [Candidatus Sulfotelmatobacter sp.]